MDSKDIVEKQVEAYNTRNLEKFLDCHADDVQLFSFSESKPYSVGKENLKNVYQDVFENSPDLHTNIINRMVMGNIVIDHEIVTGRKGVDTSTIIAIYEIENGLISKARFIREK